MFVQIVVASNGDGGGTERQRLQAQMEGPGVGNNSGGCGLGTRWDESEEGSAANWTRRPGRLPHPVLTPSATLSDDRNEVRTGSGGERVSPRASRTSVTISSAELLYSTCISFH
jgi:hypothetical protein